MNRRENYVKRSRGQKRPVPEEEKDEKYIIRRQKNNLAAKKSRDLRKLREEKVLLILYKCILWYYTVKTLILK